MPPTTAQGLKTPTVQVHHYGPLDQLLQYVLPLSSLNTEVPGKVFVQKDLQTTGMEISLNQLPAGAGLPFRHRHQANEEVYVFVRGQGQMMVDDAVFTVQEGSVVAVQPEGNRALRSTGEGDLVFIVIQAKAGSLGPHTFDDGVPDFSPITWPDATP